jgi:putative chitinase
MVSRDTVLTAGHCVHQGTLEGKWHTEIAVFPGRNGAVKPFGRCGAKKLFALGGWVASSDPMEARYYDLGAIKLDCDAGGRTGWFGIRTLEYAEIGMPVVVQGYPADSAPPGRQWESQDQLRHVLSLKLFYQNDTWGGMSGSPAYSPADNRIFGVHTNGVHNGEPWKSNNGATRITPERLKVVMQWIGG